MIFEGSGVGSGFGSQSNSNLILGFKNPSNYMLNIIYVDNITYYNKIDM